MPSSSRSSRIRQASGVSPACSLPPGNSHKPAIGLLGGRCATSTRPSASTRAQAVTTSRGRAGAPGSGPVVGIDVDVTVGEIAGPHRGLAGPSAYHYPDRDLPARPVGGHWSLVEIGHGGTVARDLMAAEGDAEPAHLHGLAGLADGHDDAAPICVAAGDRGLDQG